MDFHKAPHTYTGEVYLNVMDLDRSVRFYKEIIGFNVLEETANRVVLTADGKTPLLVIEQPDNVTPKEPRRTGLYHFALLLPERADLGNIIKHFVANNVAIGASDHKVSEALYLSDPDGNGIEIYTDREPSEWNWENGEVAMSTDPLDGESVIAESAGQTWNGLPAETIMGHVHLHVANLGETETFYKALGFELACRYPGALFMSTGKYHHHLGLNVWNGEGAQSPSINSVGLKQYTLIFPDDTVLNEAINNIKAKVEATDNGFITEDPSGNRMFLRVG
ncbi:VOC family protein [Sporosarcina sp. Marseille-Q4063]|uniref:VOC family protein n=1 Tax=Sporosarcina sp. Marseille-Q4063 TaxID=2810514 RepID=UPI001BAEDBA0|nr:VOC family protein [Sporosarcina sp. Marseille-Q4063]QUW20849.1 VOC family protein [Sporosarcina sp. Marseille-Q4063]